MATKWLTGGKGAQHGDAGQREDSRSSGIEQGGVRFLCYS